MQGMQNGANFCAALLLLYHTSDWFNQQTLQNVRKLNIYLSVTDELSSFQQNL